MITSTGLLIADGIIKAYFYLSWHHKIDVAGIYGGRVTACKRKRVDTQKQLIRKNVPVWKWIHHRVRRNRSRLVTITTFECICCFRRKNGINLKLKCNSSRSIRRQRLDVVSNVGGVQDYKNYFCPEIRQAAAKNLIKTAGVSRRSQFPVTHFPNILITVIQIVLII